MIIEIKNLLIFILINKNHFIFYMNKNNYHIFLEKNIFGLIVNLIYSYKNQIIIIHHFPL